MHWSLWVVALLGAGFAVDRLLLAAEGRGWVYWRRRKSTSSTAGHALMSVAAIFEPAKEHVVNEEQRRHVSPDDDSHGEPLVP